MTTEERKKMPATPTTNERAETRYLIYETDDLGRNLRLIGEQLATSSDQAQRRFLDANDQRVVTAISENHCKLRVPAPKIVAPSVQPPEPVAGEQEPVEQQELAADTGAA